MSRVRSGSRSALLPVAVAAFLIAFSLAGARLYASSAGSASLGQQLDETCRADSALVLPFSLNEPGAEQRVREMAAGVPFVEPGRAVAVAQPIRPEFLPAERKLTMVWIDGVDQAVSPSVAPLAPYEIAVSESNLSELVVDIGGRVTVDGARLTVTQSFTDIPYRPLPSFWCGFPQLFEPTFGGDLPPPSAIASRETIAALGGFAYVEFRVVDEALTLSDAAEIEAGYERARSAWEAANPEGDLERTELGRVVERARQVNVTVERNLAPVTLTGAAAGGIVLVAAAVLLARDRARELRLLAVRGMPPWRLAGHVAPGIVTAVGTGTVVGFATAWIAVVGAGPSSSIERSALVGGAALCLAGLVLGALLVAAVVGVVGDGFADARSRRLGARWAVGAAVMAMLALAALAFRRLDTRGGIRTFGVESRGGDLLAMGFPLFAVLAVGAVAAVVVAAVAGPLRLTGKKRSRAIRLGWRRVVLERGPLAAIVLSVALAAGCFGVANSLADSAQLQLADKADVYVGSDLAVEVYDPVEIPADWEQRTTMVGETSVKWDGDRADLVGIDRARFPRVARFRGDGADRPLAELVEVVEAPASFDPSVDTAPMIAVDAGLSVGDLAEVELPGRIPFQLEVVAVADFFPGKKSGVPMFVIDEAVMDAAVQFPTMSVLVRDPPSDAVQVIRSQGVRTGLILDVDDAFDGSAYSALRWAYRPLATLGGLFAVVALSLQLLVIAARRRQRQIAHVVMRRTGFTSRQLWLAAVVETGVPLVAGVIAGLTAAWASASLAVTRLDPMPRLMPPARFVVPIDVLVVIAVAVPIWTALIAGVIVRSTVRSDPMNVMRGAV